MDMLKKVVGFVLSLVAGWLGYETTGSMAITTIIFFGVVYASMEAIKVWGYLGTDALKIVSWLLGPAYAMAFWLLQLGLFEGLPWFIALLIGITASVAAIFVYLSEWLEAVLALIIPWFREQQEWKKEKIIAIDKMSMKKAA